MSKVLDVSALIMAAYEARLPNVGGHRARLEAMAESLAFDLARHLKVEMDRGAEVDKKTGRLVALFGPKVPNQPCPAPIERYDPQGAWVHKPRPE